MSALKFWLSLGAIGAAYALPSTVRSAYTVKERHTVPRGWSEAGPASKSEIIHLQIGLKQSNEGAVEKHLTEISDPSHPRYGQHLTATEIDRLVRPSEESVDLVEEWLMEHGINGHTFNSAKDWITIAIPVEKAEELLQTTYSKFEHSDGSSISRTPEWSLPAHLHEHIDVVQPTTSFFRPGPELWKPILDHQTFSESELSAFLDTSAAGAVNGSVSSVCNITFTTPTCIRTLYGTIDYTPQVPSNNSIGICNYLNETNKRSDISKFLKNFRPEAAAEANEFKIITIANASNDQGPYTPAEIENETNFEGNLDAELVLSITYPTPMTAYSTGGSPPYKPDLATTSDTNEPYLTFLNYALAQSSLPHVISTSYGDDEQTVPESYAKRVCHGYAQLGSRGISILFSSGDSGVGSNGTCFSNVDKKKKMFIPEFPTSCPWVTSVGATQAFEPEVAVTRFGSGAGFSNYFAQPSYQKTAVNAYIQNLNGLYDGLYNKSGRAYPDVAAQGNHDAIVWNNNITTIGGTSASVPTFSSVIALVNDALIAKGKPTLGFLNPWIYGGAYKALTDITSGSSIGCNSSGFPAAEGWDAVTGFGTPNFGKLVDAAFEKYSGGYGDA